jgi:hypothetical protein
MTNDEIQEFIKMFKGVIPDPDNYPVTFDYYYQLYKHMKQTKENKNV